MFLHLKLQNTPTTTVKSKDNKMIRKLISKLNKSINERVAPPRQNFEVPIKIWLEPDKDTGRLQAAIANLSISGETKNLSHSGIAFLVSVIRLREFYLAGENHTLNVELDLPNGKVKMQIVGQRYEQISDEHSSISKYLIGAKILRISAADKEAYEEFLQIGKKIQKEKTGNLELEVDKR